MKKQYGLLFFLLVLTLLCSIFIFASCGRGGGNNAGNNVSPTKLTAPTVILTDDTATWNVVSHADKFEISIDGSLSYVESSVTSKILTNGQTFKIRAIGDGVNYTNSDWSNSVTYVKSSLKYTVVWKNGDTILETDENVEYGTMPIYNGGEPKKAADTQYVYVFSGWSPVVSKVVGNVTYEAQFTRVPNSYTIIWKNGDTVLETDENVTYGSTPTYDGAVPTKAATAKYTYTFKGWTPQISSVTESVTYQAEFTENIRSYTITFYSEDGTKVLDTVTVEYGSNATYSKSAPVKNATEGHTYVFEKWVTAKGGSVTDDLTNVIGDRSVYASFKEFVRTVTVYIVSNNTDYGTVSVSALNNVQYGAEITVKGNTITVNGQSVTANPNTATAQYTYTFANWTADSTVGNDTIITANFSRSVNLYTITWKNGDTVLEIDKNVIYGATPVYNGTEPTKDSDDKNIYVFSGWLPTISTVTGDITYVAQFTTAENKHTVVFYDDDGVTELGRVVVGHGENAVYPNALPTKESTDKIAYTFEKWVTTKGGSTEASFENITGNRSVYAKYSTNSRTYSVSFCDYDGTILSQSDIAYGSAATPPEEPEREGYRFNGWDKDAEIYSYITCDITVKATYIKQITVEFLDYDNSVIDIQLIDYNGNATAPPDPTRNNYRFTGWNTGFTNVVHELTVKAEYIRQYKVTFLGYNQTVEVVVDVGTTAVAPNASVKEGYDFDGWDKEFTNVSSDITVTAVYKAKTYTVKFVMPDGSIIGEEQSVEHGFSAIAPESPEFYLEGKGRNTKAYGFTKWNKSFANVTEDLVIKAVYESDYKKPIIIIEYSQERNGNAKLYIYNHVSVKLDAIEFKIKYSTSGGNISVDSVSINSASPLYVEDNDGNNNNQYVINNNEHTFTFAWFDTEKKKFDYCCSEVITFNFSIDGTDAAVVGEETFRIYSCSAAVTESEDKKPEKIIPVVVYR